MGGVPIKPYTARFSMVSGTTQNVLLLRILKTLLWRNVNKTWLDNLNSHLLQRNARAHSPIWILFLFSKLIGNIAFGWECSSHQKSRSEATMKSSKGKGPVNGSKPPKKLPPTTPGKKQKPKDPVEVSVRCSQIQRGTVSLWTKYSTWNRDRVFIVGSRTPDLDHIKGLCKLMAPWKNDSSFNRSVKS